MPDGEPAHALIGCFSGIVDENDRVHPDGYPGALRSLVGGHVRELSPLPQGGTVQVRASGGQELLPEGLGGTGTVWQDDLVAEGARALAVYTEGYLAGQPAVLDHAVGDGRSVYVGTQLDGATFARLLRAVLRRAGVSSVLDAPDGVEVTRRDGAEERFLFLLNHRDEAAQVRLARAGRDLLTGARYAAGDDVPLGGAGVAVISSPR